MKRGDVERVVALDWSGDRSAAGQRRKIWGGVWTRATDPAHREKAAVKGPAGRGSLVGDGSRLGVDGGLVRLEAGRTRDEVAEWLIAMARETPRMVVGFDFCFSFPGWFVQEMGCADAPAFWELVERRHGELWLARECADARFWGKAGAGRDGKRPAEFSGERLHRMLRATDIDCKIAAIIPEAERAARVRGIAPKSVFQIGGAGAVGTASLRGMPVLRRLREAGFRVWPFDEPDAARPMVVEMYTRLNTGAVRKSNGEARAAYLKRRRAEDAMYATLPRGVLAKARGSEDAFDALVSLMVMTARRRQFARLRMPKYPGYRVEGWTWAP